MIRLETVRMVRQTVKKRGRVKEKNYMIRHTGDRGKKREDVSEREGEGERENSGQMDTEHTEKQLARQQKQAYNHLQLALLNSELVDHGPSLAVPMGQTEVD